MEPRYRRTSETSTYRDCRQRWYWSYIQRLAPPRTANALAFGTMIHSALEQWYIPGKIRGLNPAIAFRDAYLENDTFSQWDEDGNKVSSFDLGMAMLEGYVAKYGTESEIDIVCPERVFEREILDKKGNYLATYVCKLDAVFRNNLNGRIGLLEHKTAKTIDEVRINSGYGDQGLRYWYFANLILREEGILAKGQLLDGVLYNFLRKGMPDERPKNAQGLALNKDGSVSKVQKSPLFVRQWIKFTEQELKQVERRIRAEAWEMREAEEGRLPIYKNPSKDCSWKCQFRDMCEIHEMGGHWEDVRDMTLTEWNPYDYVELEQEKQ